jgi:hypothetical protein
MPRLANSARTADDWLCPNVYTAQIRRWMRLSFSCMPDSAALSGHHLAVASLILLVMSTRCVFCGAEGGLTNEDVLPRWLLKALQDAPVTGTVVYRQSKGRPGDAPAVYSRPGKSLETKARAVCATCNNSWMSQIEQSVSAILPELVKGRRVLLPAGQQDALARWSVKTILMLQHTHKRSHQVVIPPGAGRVRKRQSSSWPRTET